MVATRNATLACTADAVIARCATTAVTDKLSGGAAKLFAIAFAIAAGVVAAFRLTMRAAIGSAFGIAVRADASAAIPMLLTGA